MLLSAFYLTGCSGESNPPMPFPFEIPEDLRFSGSIKIQNIAINNLPKSANASIKDLSIFEVFVEDETAGPAFADIQGRFKLAPISIRDQAVIYAKHSLQPNFILEWMAKDTQGLFGEMQIEINIQSTAASMIARSLRERYGRRIDPRELDASIYSETVSAIADVLERTPNKLGETRLDQIPSVVQAYTSASKQLHENDQGKIQNRFTLLYYLAGDNSLAPEIADNLDDIANSPRPDNTQIIVQAALPIDGTKRYMHNGEKLELLGSAGHVDSSNPAVLADFVTWARRAFPAEKQILIISSHSDGWKSLSSLRPSIISDETAGNTGIPIEFAGWLTEIANTFDGYNRPLDLLVFDACSMGMVEIAMQFSKAARYSVLSQAFVPGTGFPHGRIINTMNQNESSLDIRGLARIFCEEYKNRYLKNNVKIPATISKIDNSKFDDFVQAFTRYTNILLSSIEQYAIIINMLRDKPLLYEEKQEPNDQQLNIRASSAEYNKYVIQAFEQSDHRDLRDFVIRANPAIPAAQIEAEALLVSLSELVRINYHSEWFFPRAGGISIALPDPETFSSSYAGKLEYFGLDFVNNTRWGELISIINNL